jgi:hypothetical protein
VTPSTFEVGEIATVIYAGDFPEYLNTDCTIIGPLERREGFTDGQLFMVRGYACEMCDGRHLYLSPMCLKKKGDYDGALPSLWDDLVDTYGKQIWKPRTIREKA